MKNFIFIFIIFFSSFTLANGNKNKADYDYIVVGAGSAGSIVAAKIAEAGERVLLLEAGGDNTDPAIKNMKEYFNVAFNPFDFGFLNWNYKTTPQNFLEGSDPKIFTLPQGRVLGGSHSINATAFVTGHRNDFNRIARQLNDPEWSWDSIESYMEELKETLDTITYGKEQEGAIEHIKAAEKLGFHYNKNCIKGQQNGICDAIWTGSVGDEGGVRSTSYDTYVRPLLTDESVKLVSLIFHRVDKINFDINDPSRVVSVSAMNLRSNIPVEFTAEKDIIISAGTYASPKILLQSGVGPKNELEKYGITTHHDLIGVGKNLRDHYSVATFWNLESLTSVSPYLFSQPNFSIFGPEERGTPSYQFEISGGFGSVVPLRAKSVGEVTLGSNNPDDAPMINPRILSSQEDLDALVTGLRFFILPFFKDLVDQGIYSVGNINPLASNKELVDFVRNNINSSHHPVGTSKVGKSVDPFAVVDNNFLVHGTKNLRVVDASVFPVVPSGNINAPVMAIALLAADKLIEHKSRKQLEN